MPVVIEQTFPLGRFHARRWNQPPFDPNCIEWPPSPWRLLRALVARWFQYERETGDDDTQRRDSVLAKLATTVPSFLLPVEASGGPELRQYQPTEVKFTKVKREPEMRRPLTTLVPDRTQQIPPDAVILWIWNAPTLSPEERNLLCNLLRRIHYFGRAESWTRMRLRADDEPLPRANITLEGQSTRDALPVLVNVSPNALIDRLLKPTGDKGLANRSVPVGTGWRYASVPTRADSTTARASRPRAHSAAPPRIQVVRYALDSTVLPLATETLPVAEAARRALMFHLVNVRGRDEYGNAWSRDEHKTGRLPVSLAGVFSGKDEAGDSLTGHGHAYYLPTDEDADGRLDHLTIFARDGFGPDERRALDRLRQLNTGRRGEERHPLRLLLLGIGTLDEYHPGPLQASQVWLSATPYVATRHAKTRGRDRIDMSSPVARAEFLITDLRDQIRAVLHDVTRNADDVKIDPVLDGGAFKVAGRWRPIQFKRFRRKPGDDGGRRLAGAFRMEFPSEIRGPVALGHSAHFGLGLFVCPRFL